MLSYTNKLFHYILEAVEVSLDCLFRESELRQISADDFSILCSKNLLEFHQYNPEGSNFPCPDQSICGETCDRIIRKIKGRFEAVCPDSSSAPIVLSQENINKYSFDIKALAEVIRNDNELNGSYEEFDDRLYFIGIKEVNKQNVALVLALLNNPKIAESLLLTLQHKLSRYPAKVILSPFFNQLSQQALRTLETGNIYLYDFSKAFIDNNWVINPKILSSVISKLKPLTETAAKFSLPSGVSLSNVFILFDSPTVITGNIPEWVKVSCPGKSRRFHYAEFGCKDAKSGKPDKQWQALYIFARNHGTISWAMFNKKKSKPEVITEESGEEGEDISPDKSEIRPRPSGGIPALEKRIQALRQILKPFFDIQEDPFHPYSTKDGYRAKFQIGLAEEEPFLDSEPYR